MISRLIEWLIRLWGGAEQRERDAEKMADIIAKERDARVRSADQVQRDAEEGRGF